MGSRAALTQRRQNLSPIGDLREGNIEQCEELTCVGATAQAPVTSTYQVDNGILLDIRHLYLSLLMATGSVLMAEWSKALQLATTCSCL